MSQRESLLRTGSMFLEFRVVRLIGRGGVGEVYEVAYQGKRYALKVVPTAWLDQEADVRRLTMEGQMMEWMKHPNVVRVHATGVTPDRMVWIRMELLHGHTLREIVYRRGALSPPLACAYMRSAGLAAHQCHVLGAVHRDIKPENVFVTRDERVKLLDFGIAKLYGGPQTADGHRKGTPPYMAPEQIRGQLVTPATDIYALGMMAHEMLLGRHPFVENVGAYDIYELFNKHFFDVPAPLTEAGVPAAIARVVARALHKKPEERQQRGLEFAEDLWAAWESTRERGREGEEGETYPGEPPMEELVQWRSDVLRFGTGPEASFDEAITTRRSVTGKAQSGESSPTSTAACACSFRGTARGGTTITARAGSA